MYDSIIAAKYMLALAQSRGKILNATQLQKILFIAYGYMLAKDNELILSEAPKAWPFGPVFPRVQNKVNAYSSYNLNSPEFNDIKENEIVTSLFNQLIDKYSKYSATQLSDWSHSEGSPWDETTKQAGFKWNMVIPDILIKNYFAKVNV